MRFLKKEIISLWLLCKPFFHISQSLRDIFVKSIVEYISIIKYISEEFKNSVDNKIK